MENSITNNKPTHKNESRSPGVMDKFLRLQNQLGRAETHYKDVRFSINLLDRFVQGESLNQVVVTLYPEDQGYTLSLKIHNVVEGETGFIPYSEDELLNCIDNQQLPPVLVEILEEVGAQQVFYDGCVFVHIKDMRESSKHTWNVLLKPTPQSIVADARQICQEQGWGPEEMLQLESVLCMAMAEPLCLSPNPMLGELAVNRDRASKQMQSIPLRKSRRTWCESKKRKLADASSSSSQPSTHFQLHDFLKKKSLLGRGIPPILQAPPESFNSISGPSTSTASVQLDVSDVLRLAKPLERPKETGDCSMIPCEEYLYETDKVNGRVYLVRFTILQRPATEEFLGQLYVDRDFRDGKLTGGASCMFSLGSRLHVNRYIQQFTEIFTEEGRKSVKITHQVQGHPPRIMYTQSMREKERLKEKEEPAPTAQPIKEPNTDNNPAPTNPTTPAMPTPVKIEQPQQQASGTLTKKDLLESLKSGQVPPAIATLVSSLLTNNQQQQQPQRPASNSNTATVVVNGHHQIQQQSLLRAQGVVGQRPTLVTTVPGGAIPVQSFTIQPQLRPNGAAGGVRPTTLATLLSTSKAGALPANVSPGKGKVMQVDGVSVYQGNAVQMGQVIRPAVAGQTVPPTAVPILPSYSQAISQTGTTTVVRAIRPAAPVAVARRPPEAVALNGSTTQRYSLTVPALSALLAGTPSADSPGANSSAASAPIQNNVQPSLLERLQQQSPTKPSGGATNAFNNNNHHHIQIKPGVVPNNNLNVQSINLTGVQGAVANLQSIQVSIPGLSVPLSLSLAVSSSGTTSVSTVSSTAGVLGSVRLANSVTGQGQPISIPLSVLQQIPNAGNPVQLMTNNKEGASVPFKMGNNVQQLPSGAQPSSGSQLAQQQLQMVLQRQVQLQKVAAANKQKSKPPNS